METVSSEKLKHLDVFTWSLKDLVNQDKLDGGWLGVHWISEMDLKGTRCIIVLSNNGTEVRIIKEGEQNYLGNYKLLFNLGEVLQTALKQL